MMARKIADMFPASYPRRCAAVAIDMVCAALPLWLVSPVAGVFWGAGADGRLAALTMLTANALLSFALYFVVQAVQLARGRRTPGRRLLKLDVVGDRGRLGLRRALAREGLAVAFAVACLASALYPLLLLPVVWSLIDTDSKAGFDRLLGVRVCFSPTASTECVPQEEPAPAR